jgi:hypothetical protein
MGMSYAIEGLGDRSAATITLLLAMVAYKYVISESLPRINYVTLIDVYVLGSFLLAFAVMADQTCIALSMYSEAFVHLGNAGNASEVTSSSTASVEISTHIFMFLVVWLGGHLVGLVAILLHEYLVLGPANERWTRSETTLWVGPLTDDAFKNPLEEVKAALTDEASKALDEAFTYIVQNTSSEADIHTPRLIPWTPESANRSMMAAHKSDWYEGTNLFAVAIFPHAVSASAAMAFSVNRRRDRPHHLEEAEQVRNALRFFKQGMIRIEVLDDKYMALANEPTLPSGLRPQQAAAAAADVTSGPSTDKGPQQAARPEASLRELV